MFNNIFEKLKNGLEKTRNGLTEKISTALNLAVKIDENLYDDLEDILISSDVGVNTTLFILEKVKIKVKQDKIIDPLEVKNCLKDVMLDILGEDENKLMPKTTPEVMLIIGVNGVGKTTSIGKIALKLKASNYKVILAAADTFRAAAIDQLEIWSSRAGVELIKQNEGSDPAAVIFDAIGASKARKADILICDTAGRLHNKKNLMDELSKINKVISKEYPEACRETFLVLDATTGQNAIVQAKQFMEVCKIDGIILTKLDGTAKGGVVISIKHQLNIPVRLIGVGESIDDLQDFDPIEFVKALF